VPAHILEAARQRSDAVAPAVQVALAQFFEMSRTEPVFTG